MNATIEATPGPGIYENVPFSDYLAWPYISNSSLNAAERSMFHYKNRKPVAETDAMRFGTFCHLGRLEPSAIYRRYVVMPDLTQGVLTKSGEPAKNPKTTTEYESRVARWKADNAGDKQIVEQADFDRMVGVVAALDRDPLAREWFSSDGPAEVCLVWDDPDTGLRCKSRLDKWATRLQLIADLKTCRDCLRFETDIAERNYHRQGAMYLDGLEILTRGEMHSFGLAAVENEEPFGTMTAPVSEEALEIGRDSYKAALRSIKAARESGVWSGYSSPPAWKLPAWKQQKSEPFNLKIGGETVSL